MLHLKIAKHKIGTHYITPAALCVLERNEKEAEQEKETKREKRKKKQDEA